MSRAHLTHADTNEQRAPHLHNLGVRLSELGRRDEALTAAGEAVEIYRRLTDQLPRLFHDDLVDAEASLQRCRAALDQPPSGSPADPR